MLARKNVAILSAFLIAATPGCKFKSDVLIDNIGSMQRVERVERLIPFDHIVAPTLEIEKVAKQIAAKSKSVFDVCFLVLSHIKKFRYVISREPGLPKRPAEVEATLSGDCNEQSIYLYSLLSEIKKHGNFKFVPFFLEIYVDESGRSMEHFAVGVSVQDGESKGYEHVITELKDSDKEKFGTRFLFILDPTSKKITRPKVFRLLNKREFVASYYCDGANSFAANRKFKECGILLNNALKLDRDSPFVLLNYGAFLFNQEKFTEALNLGKKIIELTPEWPKGYILLGRVYLNTKKYNEALQFFEKAKELDPKNTTIDKFITITKKYLSK